MKIGPETKKALITVSLMIAALALYERVASPLLDMIPFPSIGK